MTTENPASFKDPDARIVYHHGSIYRLIFRSYKDNFDLLNSSGLCEVLQKKGYLIRHTEVDEESLNLPQNNYKNVYRVIKPETLSFISYPCEWTFGHFKSAALLTLRIQLEALKHGLSLKDATAYNVQFNGASPVFIDTSSFEAYKENKPWVAYGQFCRHFLGPLLLYVYNRPSIVKLSQVHLDGIPLRVISDVLPFKTKFSFSVQTHIHYHAKLESDYSNDSSFKGKEVKLSKERLVAFITHLYEYIKGLQLPKIQTEWGDYYTTCNYSPDVFDQKKRFVERIVANDRSRSILDLGSNSGEFSLLIEPYVKHIVAADIDYLAVNKLFEEVRKRKIEKILPLVLNISEPTPSLGWMNEERSSFLERGKFDMVLALALIHHLAIGNNLPLDKIACFFAKISKKLIMEFVPKEDRQTQRLLVTKEDIFSAYNIGEFKRVFSAFFEIREELQLPGTERTLFYMIRHEKHTL